ncbi:MAG: 4-hydroxy-tetrahydrodipicolinate reductase [Acidimicrobiia bacterium]
MIRVSVSGAAGRMGQATAAALAGAHDIEVVCLYDPLHDGLVVADRTVAGDPLCAIGSEVVVEFTHPEVVMENLERWRRIGAHVVVGTSGFDQPRIDAVAEIFGDGPPNCLIVPNFSIGAVLMMRFAEMAAPFFAASEVIELHHDRKVDAPSGTAIATAARMAAASSGQRRHTESTEITQGARGASVDGVPVHSVRLPGLLAHQEVLLGNDGEVLTIRHDSTDRSSFMPGVLLAVRNVAGLPGVNVGLDPLLG